MAGIDTRNMTRRSVPRFPYARVADEVLPDWDVSLVFVGPKKARDLNIELRGKSYIPNVLSYALGEKNGEIFICLEEAERQAPEHEMDARTFVLFLFIHGLLHLKGQAHGATMERCEKELLAKYAPGPARKSSHGTTHSNRNRHRHLPGKGSGR